MFKEHTYTGKSYAMNVTHLCVSTGDEIHYSLLPGKDVRTPYETFSCKWIKCWRRMRTDKQKRKKRDK